MSPPPLSADRGALFEYLIREMYNEKDVES